jgi:hypothetical protein
MALSIPTTNLSALAPITTTATALSNLILAVPQILDPASVVGYQPQNPPLPDGTPNPNQPPPSFLFNFEGEQKAQIQSDITDHYIEDNTALQDQIALRPVVITTQGFIGELTDIAPPSLAPVKQIANKLTIVSAYTPDLSVSALIAYNTAFQLYQTAQNAVTSAVSAWSSINGNNTGTSVITGTGTFEPQFNGLPNQSKQQLAFQQLYGYWNTRTLFTIQTPWAIFQNMAILSMTPIQDADQAYITTFEMSFKQMRFASTSLTDIGGNTVGANQQGRAVQQSASLTNLGTSSPSSAAALSDKLGTTFGVA